MDPKTLEQLLDCPVCFERLDETNRVLPCQHTFCKKCLETVKSKYSELRCPECRTKYNGSMKDLPCNIFVIRILEQLKQVERKAQSVKSSSVKTITKSTSSSVSSTSHLHVNVSKPDRTSELTQASSIIDSMSRLVIRDRPEPVGSSRRIGCVSNSQRNPSSILNFRCVSNSQRSPIRISQDGVNLPTDTSDEQRRILKAARSVNLPTDSSDDRRRILKAVRKQQASVTPQHSITSLLSPSTVSPSSSQPRVQNGREEKPSFSVNSSFSFCVELGSTGRNVNYQRRGRRKH